MAPEMAILSFRIRIFEGATVLVFFLMGRRPAWVCIPPCPAELDGKGQDFGVESSPTLWMQVILEHAIV